jgi:deoxyguanosine kinase
MITTEIYIGLGSNLGDKKSNIISAIEEINKIASVDAISSFYESEPWGFESVNTFINNVIEISTELTPLELFFELKKIEKSLGRKIKKSDSYENRIIDLDILYYNNQIIENDTITIPHKQIENRLFVLKPLNEIKPKFIDPIKNLNISHLLSICPDKSNISIIEDKIVTKQN